MYGPVFSIDDGRLTGVVIHTFVIDTFMRDILFDVDNQTIQFLVRNSH